MSDDEVSEFVIGRLGELLVVLFNEHVGSHAEAVRARTQSRLILTALGNWAAGNGRADLMPLLHGLAVKIKDPSDAYEPDPPFYEPVRTKAKIKFRW